MGFTIIEILVKLKIVGNWTVGLVVAILGIDVASSVVDDIATLIHGSASVDHLAALGSDVKVDAKSDVQSNTADPANRAIATGAALSRLEPLLAGL